MSHSHYLANKVNNTCFELGKSLSDTVETWINATIKNEVQLDDFIEMLKLDTKFTEYKIRQLYDFIKVNHDKPILKLVYHEDVLCESTFNNDFPIYQIGSLYENCNIHVFKQWGLKEYANKNVRYRTRL